MKNVSIFKKSGSTSWFIQYTVGNATMTSITPRHIDKWKAEVRLKPSRRGGQLSFVYINIQFRALKAAFNTALRWGILVNAIWCKYLSGQGLAGPFLYCHHPNLYAQHHRFAPTRNQQNAIAQCLKTRVLQ